MARWCRAWVSKLRRSQGAGELQEKLHSRFTILHPEMSAKVLTYGSDSSGTVKVFLNGQEKGSASANTVSQKAELVFNTGGQGFADLGDGSLEFNALPAISARRHSAGARGRIHHPDPIHRRLVTQRVCLSLSRPLMSRVSGLFDQP